MQRPAQAHYRAALALEALGRPRDAVQRAERALSLQSSAGQCSSGQVSVLVERLRCLSVSSSASTSVRKPAAAQAESGPSAAGPAESEAQDFLEAAAPRLAGERR